MSAAPTSASRGWIPWNSKPKKTRTRTRKKRKTSITTRTRMRMKRKRKPRKRIGTSRALLATLLAAVLLPAAFLPLQAAPKKKPALDVYALISVSVFDDSGYALAGANVTVAPEVESDS